MNRRFCIAGAVIASLGLGSSAFAAGSDSFETYTPGGYFASNLDNGQLRWEPNNLASAYNTLLTVVNDPGDATHGDNFLRITRNPGAAATERAYVEFFDLTGAPIDGYRLQFDIRVSDFSLPEIDYPVAIHHTPVADTDPLSWPGAWPQHFRWSTNGQTSLWSNGAGFDWGGHLSANTWYRYTADYSIDAGNLVTNVSIHDVLSGNLVGTLDGLASGAWNNYNKGLYAEIFGAQHVAMDIDRVNVIPEPTTFALAGLGGLLLLPRRRRDRC